MRVERPTHYKCDRCGKTENAGEAEGWIGSNYAVHPPGWSLLSAFTGNYRAQKGRQVDLCPTCTELVLSVVD